MCVRQTFKIRTGIRFLEQAAAILKAKPFGPSDTKSQEREVRISKTLLRLYATPKVSQFEQGVVHAKRIANLEPALEADHMRNVKAFTTALERQRQGAPVILQRVKDDTGKARTDTFVVEDRS